MVTLVGAGEEGGLFPFIQKLPWELFALCSARQTECPETDRWPCPFWEFIGQETKAQGEVR